MVALIDGDSIRYVLAWHFKDQTEIAIPAMKQAIDEFMHNIFTRSHATSYIAAFSASKTFRYDLYKYRPYKGNRPSKPEFLVQWDPVIQPHLLEKWGFYQSPNLEADDVVAALSVLIEEETIICSPDKDLKQMPGLHYNYGKDLPPELITTEEACRNLWTQILVGDTSDNIAGVPGIGPDKVKKLFAAAEEGQNIDDITLMQLVKEAYVKYFGEWYGQIIFTETLKTVMLMQPKHPLWTSYWPNLADLYKMGGYLQEVPQMELGNEPDLSALGWLEG